jgi:hypothetical protein
MSLLLRLPHGLIRRYLSVFERLATAGLLAGLVYALTYGSAAYPPYWEIVIAAAVLLAAAWMPAAGYFLAVAAVTYPLYTVSIYLAVIFLAVALLGARTFIYSLGATTLVLAAPWLAPVYLAWLAPVLGGLWWGAAGGAAMGFTAALWGQTLAGMTGLMPDWLAIFGYWIDLSPAAARFAGADSLETLRLLAQPFTPDSTSLLYYALQIALWTLTGALVGALAERAWTQRRKPLGNMLAGLGGATLLCCGHLGAAIWLNRYTPELRAELAPTLAGGALVTALVAALLEGGRDLLEHPLPPERRPAARRAEAAASTRPAEAAPAAPPAAKDSPPARGQTAEADDQTDPDDLIMLELD